MLSESGKHFSETFLIWNEKINFVGAVIPTPEGRAKISGSVIFRKNKELLFSSPKDDPDVLHQKLISICQFLAKFYRTEILYRKIRFQSPKNDTDSLMTKIGYFLN